MIVGATTTSIMLLQGLRQAENPDAWQQFHARFEPLLHTFAARAGVRERDAGEIVHRVLSALIERFRKGQYDGQRGQLRTWLRAVAVEQVGEYLRSRPDLQATSADGARDAGAGLDGVGTGPDGRALEVLFDQEWERRLLTECLREVVGQVDALTFQAFELYAIENRPVDEVAKRLGMSRDAVCLSRRRVLARLRKLEKELDGAW